MAMTPEDRHRLRIAAIRSQIHSKNLPRSRVSQGAARRARRKIGRNEICPLCDSGKKYKKCCGVLRPPRHCPAAKRPQEKPIIAGATIAEVTTAAPAASPRETTAVAMSRAGIDECTIQAYLGTGIFVTTQNRVYHDAATLARWDAAVAAYAALRAAGNGDVESAAG